MLLSEHKYQNCLSNRHQQKIAAKWECHKSELQTILKCWTLQTDLKRSSCKLHLQALDLMLVSHNFTCDNVYRALFNMEQMEPIITSITELVKASLNSNLTYPASIGEQMILKSSHVGRGETLLRLSLMESKRQKKHRQMTSTNK